MPTQRSAPSGAKAAPLGDPVSRWAIIFGLALRDLVRFGGRAYAASSENPHPSQQKARMGHPASVGIALDGFNYRLALNRYSGFRVYSARRQSLVALSLPRISSR